MIKVCVCDDMNSASVVEQLLVNLSKKSFISIDIDVYCTGEELCKDLQSGANFDVIYLEIDMKRLNCIDTAKFIRKYNPHVIIIFTSCNANNPIDLFEVEPFRFLKKPILENLFEEYFMKAYEKIANYDNYFDYKYNKTIYKVPMKNIIYFESEGRMINIIMKDSLDKFYGKLDQLENRLINSKFTFLRIHQSYLVNYKYIDKIGHTKLRLLNGMELQISKERSRIIQEQYGIYREKSIFDI